MSNCTIVWYKCCSDVTIVQSDVTIVVPCQLIWYRVLPQGERQFLFAVKVGCIVVWPIFSTSEMKAFCIYFYLGNITFKNIINLVSFIINLIEYLVINFFWGIRQPHFHSGEYPISMVCHLGRKFDEGITFDSLNYHIFVLFYHISTGKGDLQLLRICMVLSINRK